MKHADTAVTVIPINIVPLAVDDAMMGITHVVRAEEHLTNSLRQCLILDALEFPRPQYAHCSLILGEDRSKLSKRHGATSVGQFRQQVGMPWLVLLVLVVDARVICG